MEDLDNQMRTGKNIKKHNKNAKKLLNGKIAVQNKNQRQPSSSSSSTSSCKTESEDKMNPDALPLKKIEI